MTLTVRPAAVEEVALCADILQAAARQLQERGAALWPPEALSAARLLLQYPPESFRLGWLGGQAVASMTLLDADSAFWPEAVPGEALYLHKLGVLPQVQGQKVSTGMLEAAVSETRERYCLFLRLDTAWERPKLRAIYERFGFRLSGRKTVHGFDVALYELGL